MFDFFMSLSHAVIVKLDFAVSACILVCIMNTFKMSVQVGFLCECCLACITTEGPQSKMYRLSYDATLNACQS